jgi:hypothetical protein
MNQNPSDSGIPGDSVCSETALAEDFWKGILDTVLAIDLGIWGAIHTSLEGFQSIDLFLRLAAVPALRKHIPDDVDRRTSKT